MEAVSWRRGGWELRYRDRHGKQHCERFKAPQTRRAPDVVLERKAQVERDLRRGTYVAVEERRVNFGEYYQRWHATRRISATRGYTDDMRAAKHVLPYWRDGAVAEIRPPNIDD
ncbi:MAG TPA: hypothetical protein VHC41_01330, partial [Mycobacteriales bacterium]|nr:hypothetical protein [Mycobacteriales bacterium]